MKLEFVFRWWRLTVRPLPLLQGRREGNGGGMWPDVGGLEVQILEGFIRTPVSAWCFRFPLIPFFFFFFISAEEIQRILGGVKVRPRVWHTGASWLKTSSPPVRNLEKRRREDKRKNRPFLPPPPGGAESSGQEACLEDCSNEKVMMRLSVTTKRKEWHTPAQVSPMQCSLFYFSLFFLQNWRKNLVTMLGSN